MPTVFTGAQINFSSTVFYLHNKRYFYGQSNLLVSDLSTKSLEVDFSSNVNRANISSGIGANGYGFAGSTYNGYLDDATATVDYYIAGSSPNNSITVYGFLSAYLYNSNTGSIDNTRITGGMYRGGARWNSSGTITVTGLQRNGGYSGSEWFSPGTSDSEDNAYAFVAIDNDLYLRQRKANVTHGDIYATYTDIAFYGVSTFEPWAYLSGPGTVMTSSGVGQGIFT